MSWAITAVWVMGSIAVDSAVRSADASRKAQHTQADISKQNAAIAVDQANVNEESQRRRGAIARGKMAASAAEGSGLDGTNLDVFQQSATDTEIDALNIRYGGKIGQVSNLSQASLSDMGAQQANDAGYLNAGAAALSAYGSYQRGSAKAPKQGG